MEEGKEKQNNPSYKKKKLLIDCKTLPHLEAKKRLKVLNFHNIQTTTRAPKN